MQGVGPGRTLGVTRRQLTDEQWEFIQPYLPIGEYGPYPERLREQFEGVIWRFRSSAQWREMPSEFGPWPTVYGRFRVWRDAGVFSALLEGMIAEAARRGQADLEVLTKALDVAVGDQTGGESEEGLVDVVASFPADAQAAKAVQPGDRSLHDIAEDAQAGAVGLASFGDDRADAALPQQPPVLVVVVAAVGEQHVRPSAGPADHSGNSRDLVQQRQQLGDVVAVAAGQGHRERDALTVGEDVVLAARPCAVDRAGTAFGPRRAARTWEESITARDQSSFLADRSFLSSTRCSSSHTPASFHAASRRQHVIPEPKPSSCGRHSHWMPVCSTNKIPHNACRSGTRGRPSTSFGPGWGSNGSINAHSSSDTIQGRDCRFPTTRPTSGQANSHMINNFC